MKDENRDRAQQGFSWYWRIAENSDTQMKTAEQNFLLLQEIEANRRFLLMAYQKNLKLLKNAEARIKQLFDNPIRQDDFPPQTNSQA